MSWAEKTVIRILLMVAKMIAKYDETLQSDIQHLANHISTWAPKVEE